MLPLLSLSLTAAASFLPQLATARDEYYAQLQPCPISCSSTPNPTQWTLYSSVDRLSICKEPVLFQVSLSAPLEDAFQTTRVFACTAGDATSKTNSISDEEPEEDPAAGRIAKRADLSSHKVAPTKDSSSVELVSWGSRKSAKSSESANSLALLDKVEEWINAQKEDRRTITVFGHLEGNVVGYYSGARLSDKATAKTVLEKVSNDIKKNGMGEQLALQHCEKDKGKGVAGATVFGVVISTDYNVGSVHETMSRWLNGTCAVGADSAASVNDFPFTYYPVPKANSSTILARADECRYIRVEPNDSCGKLAERCGISPQKYTEYNSADNHCSTLKPGQAVCCSAGGKPNLRPPPGPNGECGSHVVVDGDTCDSLVGYYGLHNLFELFVLNKKTWGWNGCTPLGAGLRVCLTEGNPPMPHYQEGAVCGPTKKGTKPPTDGKELADLNPCPLKACCNVWGSCGTTKEFCTEEKSSTGAPGTSGYHDGCVQNCGMDIVNKDTAPATYRTLGYFEAWNKDRDCLHMDVQKVKGHKREYTDVHFSFGEISKDFNVVIPDNQKEQWDNFKKIEGGPRKILAFGGWAFSTEPATYQIFRDVVKPDNRKGFAQRVVDFAKDAGLSGIDFDWEYPGAPDIPGIPPGGEQDGMNYLFFLGEVKKLLPEGMSLSIAAPASFWYLKAFPIDKIAKIVDYIVYMTYDLHGQWDSGNAFASSGCPAGNCLRSHINWTETENALSMVTKAGVPTSKLLLGVSTYGRSFKMAQAGCTGPMCTYLGGKESPAKKGECTATGGYLANAEIKDLMNMEGSKSWYDEKTRSNYLVYDQTEWVAWMDSGVYDDRAKFAKDTNFGGTIEWAIDLDDFVPAGDPIDVDPEDDDTLGACNGDYATLEDLVNDIDNVDYWCGPQYLLFILQRELQSAHKRYDEIMSDGYDGYFHVYADYLVSTSVEALSKWMFDNGKEYFDCDITEELACCTSCEFEHVSCNHCIEKCKIESPYDDGHEWRNVSQPCPPDYSEAGIGKQKYRSIDWSLRKDAEEDFWASVTADIGAPQEKLPLVPAQRIVGSQLSNGCAREFGFNNGNMSPGCYHENHWWNAPAVRDFHSEDVTNPKETVQKALDRSKGLISDLAALSLEVKSGTYLGDPLDLVDAVAMPVYMIQEGLQYMEKVVEMAKEIKEAEKKAFIINLLSALLFVIPVLGETIGALGLTAMGRALVTIGELGNTGLGIYSVVDNPKAAPLFIFGLILSAKGIRDANNVRQAAKARRGMAAEDIFNFSKQVAERLEEVAKITAKGKGKQMCVRFA